MVKVTRKCLMVIFAVNLLIKYIFSLSYEYFN